jgi:hypothetical protein
MMIVVDDDVATCIRLVFFLCFFFSSFQNLIGCGFDSSMYKMLMHFDKLTLVFFAKNIFLLRGSEIEMRKTERRNL